MINEDECGNLYLKGTCGALVISDNFFKVFIELRRN